MINRANIAEFFEKYKKNLETEQKLQDSILKADDQEAWIEKLKNKARLTRSLYVENEAMLNLYIRPFLEEEIHLTDELAQEFSERLVEYNREGYFDKLVCEEIGHILEKFYQKKGSRDALIRINSLLGKYYHYSSKEDGEKSLHYFEQIRKNIGDYFFIEDKDVRLTILLSFYDYCEVMVYWNRKKENQEEILRQADWAVSVFDDPAIRALDGDKCDLDRLKKKLLSHVFGKCICTASCREELEENFLRRAQQIIEELYQESYQEKQDIFAMEDKIYCSYIRIKYFCQRSEIIQYLTEYMTYCDYVISHDIMDTKNNFMESRYYQVCMYQIPELIVYLANENLTIKNQEEKRLYYIQTFLKFMGKLPRFKNASCTNHAIKDALQKILNFLPAETIDFHYIMNRDESEMFHVEIVRRIALIFLHRIFEKKPELLINLLGTRNVIEVLKKREEFEIFVSKAAMIFDIGKVGLADIFSKRTRKLSEREISLICTHCEAGYEMVKNIKSMKPYLDIILGHHKSYDGKSGYPASFDNTSSPIKFFIDFIKICDSIDIAAGGIYDERKTMEELLEGFEIGSGTVYHPDLVQMLKEDEVLREKIYYLCNAGRIRIYYEVYQKFFQVKVIENIEQSVEIEKCNDINKEQTNLLSGLQEKRDEKEQALMSLAKAFLLIILVDFYSDKFSIIYKGYSELFKNLQEGSFRWFIREYMKERMPEENYQNLQGILQYENLSGRLYESEGLFEMELKVNDKDDYKWIRMQFILSEERNGVASKTIIMIQEIDEAKRRSEQIQAAMMHAHEQAKQENREKSIFLSNMSHDIRTPMNAIIGMTQIAMMHLDEKERVQECLEKINISSNHLMRLVDRVLDVSKIESGKVELEKEIISLKELIQDMLDMTQNEINKKDQTRSVDMEEISEEWVYGDKTKIQQIFLNLMSNGIKYTKPGGHLDFKACTLPQKYGEYNTYQFIFKDNGIGMSQEFLGKIFEPFARDQNENTKNIQGTGLGLNITKSIVELMWGNITVESELGKGSCFKVFIRLKPLEVQKDIREEKYNMKKEIVLNKHYPGIRILLTEDNEINREIAVELLHHIEIEVDVAENGKQAVDIFTEKPEHYYQMILMDIQMPVMDGYEATDHIRKIEKERGSHIPILALTANVFGEDWDRAAKHGMDAHIGKPIILSKLIEVMEQWVK